MTCPKCGSTNVLVNTFQEERGSMEKSVTKSKYKEKGHSIFWWLLVGSWWWLIDLFSWFFLLIPRLILRLFSAPFKKKKYVGRSATVSTTVNHIGYKTICTCQNCGHSWKK